MQPVVAIKPFAADTLADVVCTNEAFGMLVQVDATITETPVTNGYYFNVELTQHDANLDSGLVSGDDYPHKLITPTAGAEVKMIVPASGNANIRVTSTAVTGTGTAVADFIIPIPDDNDGNQINGYTLAAVYSVYFMSSDARY